MSLISCICRDLVFINEEIFAGPRELHMPEYIMFMHNDVAAAGNAAWEPYIRGLQERGVFQGGSEIGDGYCVRKNAAAPQITDHLVGYIRVLAPAIEDVTFLLPGNPHFEAGGTVEVRELART
jgi:hypothetical protein